MTAPLLDELSALLARLAGGDLAASGLLEALAVRDDVPQVLRDIAEASAMLVVTLEARAEYLQILLASQRAVTAEVDAARRTLTHMVALGHRGASDAMQQAGLAFDREAAERQAAELVRSPLFSRLQAARESLLPPAASPGDLWVFGYGSIIWKPPLPPVEQCIARLPGWQRSFCVRSYLHRGTLTQPGLVLGLSPDGQCHGVALRLPFVSLDLARDALFLREGLFEMYEERMLDIELKDGRVVPALTYVARQGGRYAVPNLDPVEVADVIAAARGRSGTNLAYFENTHAALQAHGIGDQRLEALTDALQRRKST
jgi:cation transport protein ChaC